MNTPDEGNAMNNLSDRYLKGGEFQNRYLITGTLVTQSPMHIGTGVDRDDVYSPDERARLVKRLGKAPAVSTVIKDAHGKPVIPGSALKGVLRHWLFDILRGISPDLADDRDYTHPDLTELDQADQAQMVLEEFSWLERLFGTPFHEGKLEVWDAMCTTSQLKAPDKLLQWNENSLTYIDTSVAINPATGTALDKLLYKTELVPPGVSFEVSIAGQNLNDLELGIVLFGLQGFNSGIYPITVGARGGRGYGRMAFTLTRVQHLDKGDLGRWVISQLQATDSVAAGYYTLPTLKPDRQAQLIRQAKEQLAAAVGGA